MVERFFLGVLFEALEDEGVLFAAHVWLKHEKEYETIGHFLVDRADERGAVVLQVGFEERLKLLDPILISIYRFWR